MVCEQVAVQGHILVCAGRGLAPEPLLQLLAPLRSTRLADWRPVVILGRPAPSGELWDQVARWVRSGWDMGGKSPQPNAQAACNVLLGFPCSSAAWRTTPPFATTRSRLQAEGCIFCGRLRHLCR
jgi:hypothetical protein